MMESYTSMNKRKFDYKWTIRNFTDYYDFVSNNKSYSIHCSMFNIGEYKNSKFILEMTISPTCITCLFHYLPINEPDGIKLACQLSILDKNNKKFGTVNGKVHYSDGVYYTKELSALKVEKEDLFKSKSDLFPDNDLKVVCNLTLFNEDTTIGPIFIPKNHQSMKDHFKELLNNQVGSDVVFEVDGQEFKLHKSILMARSPVLSAMFSNDMVENNSNRVIIEDISLSIFELLIEFIYTDEIKIKLNLETGMDLLRAASKYQLEGLEALCEAELFNLLTVHNVMEILMIAELHNLVCLVENIKIFVKFHQREIQSIIKSEHFLKHPHHLFLFFPN